MLCVNDHPLVQQIDNEISQRETHLASLQAERIRVTKTLLNSTYKIARLICHNLNINEKERSVALLCGHEYLTNIQMLEQWLLEQLVELNQSYFACPVSELQNRLLMRLNSLNQDAYLF